MIDLSFLTETEQEAILQVLQRDADLKKVEEERVRHLQDAVEDESELKYKTGQWFYEAKSKRHRDKIHGADLVRASIRKRKKPTTIAELGMSNKNRAKKSWVNSVNKDLFIPPELYGVMEGPEEVLEELKQAKVETNQSARKVSFLTPDVEKNTLNNGLASPAKLRKNPFNSENAEDVTDSVADEQIPTLENGTEPVEDLPKNDKLSPKVKFGVKLPYPELDEDSQVSLRTTNASLKSVGQPPVPKPRTLLKNDQALDRSNSQMKREDSVNGTGRPRGILKRCSSSSSTDSENIRLAHNESNRIIMPVSPILEVGRESTVTVEGSPESVDRLKHVRFSPKVLQKTPPQSPEPFIGQEIDEFRILDPSLSDLSVTNNKEFFKDTMAIELNEAPVEVSSNKNSLETPDFSVSTSTLSSASLVSDVGDMLDASSSCEEKKKVTLSESSIPDLDITSTGPEHLYAEVKKSPKTPEFDMEAPPMEPRLNGQVGTPLQFGKSYGGSGKKAFVASNPVSSAEDINILSNAQLDNPESDASNPMDVPPFVPGWRRPNRLERDEVWRPSFNLMEPKSEGGIERLQSSNFKIMSLKDRINDVSMEVTSNPSQFESLKNFWNAEGRSPPTQERNVSPSKVLRRSRRDPPQNKNSGDMAEDLILPNYEDLSEEDQTSNKVATWLAQTSSLYEDDPMYSNEDREEVNEKTVEVKKSDERQKLKDEEFSSALQKLIDEASQDAQFPETNVEPQVHDMEEKSPNKFEPNERMFYDRIVQITSDSVNDRPTLFTPGIPQTPLPDSTQSELEEIMEKAKVPPRRGQEDYISSLNKLKASEPLHDSGNIYENGQPSEEILPEMAAPAESSFKIGFENLMENDEFAPVPENLQETDEVIEKTRVGKNDTGEFISALQKLEMEASTTGQADSENSEEQTRSVVEEEIIKDAVETQKSSVDFRNRLLQLEEKLTEDCDEPNGEQNDSVEVPEDFATDEIKVSQFPNKEVFISKKVYPSIEFMPTTEKDEQASSTDKKPEIESPEVSKPSVDSKQGSNNPILSALKRSEAKTLAKPVQDVALPSSNEEEMPELKENLELEAPLVPTDIEVQESQFSNPEKLKQMSKSVPAFLHEETDGRDTDSASENSFQSGKHKKSPSSLTNLSGSSGMASMSSVSGSVMSIYSGDFGNVDIKGNIQFAIDYVDQLKEFHVFVSQCKDLAIGDVKRQRSDPYVKSYLLPEKAKMGKRKTAVKKKTLNPAYNEILRYKIDKAALQTQRLNVSVWHNDALGRNSFLGEVEIALDKWDWNNKQMNWYPLQPRTPAAGIGLEKRGEMRLSLKYVPEPSPGVKTSQTGEVHIWIKDCNQLPMLRGNKINSFVKCTILPDTSRKSRQKTRTVDKTPNPVFNHTMVYDGFKGEDLTEACVELTVWDHNKLTNHFLGGLRIGLGTGKSYGTAVDWMDSNAEEAALWEKMIKSSNTWIEGVLPLRMLKMAKLAK
ncbi:synaptotagmin-like protein 2 isoform X2 [Pelobates fuscus]|uniref:synaptotagmin-like protein 2 isoform X2 n=1 Tax=Pelobates fuscus TaxID=191477 RepID=UPI002FE43D73